MEAFLSLIEGQGFAAFGAEPAGVAEAELAREERATVERTRSRSRSPTDGWIVGSSVLATSPPSPQNSPYTPTEGFDGAPPLQPAAPQQPQEPFSSRSPTVSEGPSPIERSRSMTPPSPPSILPLGAKAAPCLPPSLQHATAPPHQQSTALQREVTRQAVEAAAALALTLGGEAVAAPPPPPPPPPPPMQTPQPPSYPPPVEVSAARSDPRNFDPWTTNWSDSRTAASSVGDSTTRDDGWKGWHYYQGPAPSTREGEGKGKWTYLGQRWRAGVHGGDVRYGNSGGKEREYYRAFGKAKGLGLAVRDAFLQEFGHPKEGTFTEERRQKLLNSQWLR